MRMRMFFTLLLSLCIADFGAFAAAPARRGGSPAASAPAGASAARAATRKTNASVPATTSAPAMNAAAPSAKGDTAARAGKKQTVKPMAARAGATQKVINNGTKVASAAANTVLDQECQNAFYGCMDSFCMVDNESGGRCQCSDRHAELKKVLDEIAKLDEQSYAMATEGVERIQMGESADAIITRAKSAGNKVIGKEDNTAKTSNATKARQLDLSAWNNSVFDEEDDVFESVTVDSSVVSDALNKTGTNLYKDSAKMCLAQMPDKCKSSLQMLQSVYAQKIKSDCLAFENSLKQQKVASTQKLQAAEKALRDAALDEFKDKNKWNLGQCVTQYSQCMESECGSDYSKCITMSAQENMKGGAGKEKDRTIKGVVDIVLAGSTMTQLLAKKTICDDEVLVHCENVRANVWDKYIAGAATTLKSAELSAEDNMRQNCIKNTAECFKNSCAAQWSPESDASNYDMCLSDPMLVYDSCKIQVEACVVATGGTADVKTEEDLKESRLWTGVTSMLAALRVDACSKELQTEIEKICGEDFAHCVGLNPGSIAELVPTDTLTACKEKNRNGDSAEVLKYISQIAQGYALKINDELYARCEAGAKEAMISVCGDEEQCSALNLGNMSFNSLLKVDLCTEKGTTLTCYNSANEFTQQDIVLGRVTPHIRNRVNINNIVYVKKGSAIDAIGEPAVQPAKAAASSKTATEDGFYYVGTYGGEYASEAEIASILKGLTNLLNNKVAVMESNKVVKECMNGKDVTGFKTRDNGTSTTRKIKNADGENQDSIFTNLLDSYKQVLISRTLDLIKEKYDAAEKELEPQIDSANAKISERLATIEGVVAEEVHKNNKNECARRALVKNIEANTPKHDKPEVVQNGNGEYVAQGGSSCDTYGGFCVKGSKHFFNTGHGRNYRREALYWVDAAYDEANSTCTLTTTKYACENYLSPYCWSWDTTGVVDGTPTVQKMPSINKEQIINKARTSKQVTAK